MFNKWTDTCGRQTIRRQMHTVNTSRERDVEAIIDKDSRARTRRKISDLADKIKQFPAAQILLADLDNVDMVTNGACSRSEHVTLASVGYVTANHSTVGRLTIFSDFQNTASSKKPRRTSMTPSPDTAPR